MLRQDTLAEFATTPAHERGAADGSQASRGRSAATEFYILRQEGTEKPYTGALLKNKKKGTYYCAGCGLAVFKSDAKYESDTGWPSFFKPIYKKNVTEKVDKSLSEERTEVECARCEGADAPDLTSRRRSPYFWKSPLLDEPRECQDHGADDSRQTR